MLLGYRTCVKLNESVRFTNLWEKGAREAKVRSRRAVKR